MMTTIQPSTLTNKDKIMFPVSGITKQDVIDYYDSMADYMIPYLKDRPLTMQRFPQGINKEGFFQKNAPDYFPEWIPTLKVKKADGWVNHVICNSKETLLYLVNQYVLTFHVALSTTKRLIYPDKLIFDLDPPKGKFVLAIKAAKALRTVLEEELDLKAYVMTSGSKGLHIAVPILAVLTFDKVRNMAEYIAEKVCRENPNEFTTVIRKEKREGKLYIDILRNSYAQTSVAPYSIRAHEFAPVATPLNWNELDEAGLDAQIFNIQTMLSRLEQIEDPWKDFNTVPNNILIAQKKIS